MHHMRLFGRDRTARRPSRLRGSARGAAWLVSLLAASSALARPTVELTVGTTTPFVNQTLLVELKISDYQKYDRPQFPELENCGVRHVGDSSGSSFRQIGGRAQSAKHITFRYALTPEKAGELTIPSIPVVVDGETFETKPRRLTVREPPTSPSPRGGRGEKPDSTSELLLAEITCEQSKLVVGQQANFTLTIWIKPVEYAGRPLPKSDMLQFITGSFGPFDTDKIRVGDAERPLADGSPQRYYIVELPAEFVVQQPGPPSFSDVSVGTDYPTRFSRDLFGDLRVARRTRVPAMRPVITAPDVQSLPAEGRPANFTGAVGEYAINVFAVPTNVRVGDPIQLVIDITGDLIETLPAPSLTAIPELVEAFRVPTETLAGTVSGRRKRFTQTIRAKRPDVKEIPSIEFVYFDPEAEEYVVARSEPLPILVSAVEQLDATDLTDITAQATPGGDSPLEVRDGLRGNRTGETELLAIVKPVTATQVVLTTVVPGAVFVCIWGLAALDRSRRGRAHQRRRAALRRVEQRIQNAVAGELRPGELHGEIRAALAGYLADRVNEPPARFLGHTAVPFLEQRGVDQELVTRWAELLERCEHAAYAGGGGADSSLADLACRCARDLERERL